MVAKGQGVLSLSITTPRRVCATLGSVVIAAKENAIRIFFISLLWNYKKQYSLLTISLDLEVTVLDIVGEKELKTEVSVLMLFKLLDVSISCLFLYLAPI